MESGRKKNGTKAKTQVGSPSIKKRILQVIVVSFDVSDLVGGQYVPPRCQTSVDLADTIRKSTAVGISYRGSVHGSIEYREHLNHLMRQL